MDTKTALEQAIELVERANIVMVGSCGKDGYPNIKAMLNMEYEGLKTFWFTTNTSSKRVQQFRENPKACIYFADADRFMGLMLMGEIEVLQDHEARAKVWRDGFEMYYPLGVNDPDHSVLKFTAVRGNYYHGLANIDFEIKHLEV